MLRVCCMYEHNAPHTTDKHHADGVWSGTGITFVFFKLKCEMCLQHRFMFALINISHFQCDAFFPDHLLFFNQRCRKSVSR